MLQTPPLPNERFDEALFNELVADISKSERFCTQKLNSETIAFFEKFSLSPGLCTFLQNHAYNVALQFGHLVFYKVNDLVRENMEELNINCINEGLLIVGCGLNGDPIVMDIGTTQMGFVFHDELWEDSSISAKSIFIETGLSIGEFYFKAATETEIFPVDAYDAEEKMKKT